MAPPSMSSTGSLLPEHEGLRRAVVWLAAQACRDAKVIEEASRRFDLSPIDEDFLLRHFRESGHGCDGLLHASPGEGLPTS